MGYESVCRGLLRLRIYFGGASSNCGAGVRPYLIRRPALAHKNLTRFSRGSMSKASLIFKIIVVEFINKSVFRTSEHVSPSHPDKVMDVLAESLYIRTLELNPLERPFVRFACDGSIKNNTVDLVGEMSHLLPRSEVKSVVTNTLEELGYGDRYLEDFDLTARGERGWNIHQIFTKQSPCIAAGVDGNSERTFGAGDIGIMNGYAVADTPDRTFAPHWMARKILRKFYRMWTLGECSGQLRPDMKCLVTMRYEKNRPVEVTSVVLCISHSVDFVPEPSLIRALRSEVEYLSNYTHTKYTSCSYYINPTGSFVNYGPLADSGQVGRKIVCDQFGGAAPVGGGNLNAKDFTKVDRSAVYLARAMANQIVRDGLAHEAVVQLAYCIGKPRAFSVNVMTDATSRRKCKMIDSAVSSVDTSVEAICDKFDLFHLAKEVQFECAAWGHIGVSGVHRYPWEDVSLW